MLAARRWPSSMSAWSCTTGPARCRNAPHRASSAGTIAERLAQHAARPAKPCDDADIPDSRPAGVDGGDEPALCPGIRVVLGGFLWRDRRSRHERHATRTCPAIRPHETTVARMIRVDHAGEYGAARIYAGQLAVLRPQRRGTSAARDAGAGAAAPGSVLRSDRAAPGAADRAAAAVAPGRVRARRGDRGVGQRAAMACTVAVEEAIDAHYASQIAALDDSEAELRDTLGRVPRGRAAAPRHRPGAWRGADARLSAAVGRDQGRLQSCDPDQRARVARNDATHANRRSDGGSRWDSKGSRYAASISKCCARVRARRSCCCTACDAVDPDAPFLDLLAAHAEIIAPSHPGFGHSPRPADFDTIYDLVHLYLDLLETLPHER